MAAKLKGDPGLQGALRALQRIPRLESELGNAIRQAIDEVIEGPRTGRWSIQELEKTEKAYIGTRVEILVRSTISAPRGNRLDYLIGGVEVDAKFSIKFGGWMIPREAVGELCFLISADDTAHKYWAGLVRASEEILTAGTNQDGKRTISAKGRSSIRWLVNGGHLPENFLMHALSATDREAIFRLPAGQARVTELLRRSTHRAVPGSAIVAAAAEFESAASRVRTAAAALKNHEVLAGDDEAARSRARSLGYELLPGYFLAVPRDGKARGGTRKHRATNDR